MTETRNNRRRLVGTVVSDQMDKTITVRVERAHRHAKYGKIVRRQKKYHAHDEQNIARIGDRVEIESTRPLSKSKRWRLIQIIVSAVLDSPETDATNPEALNVGAGEGR